MNLDLEYKGFITHIKWSEPDKCYYGKIENITDLVLFEGDTIEDCEKDFYDAVDFYISYQEEDEVIISNKTENVDISLLTPTENIDLTNLNPDNKTRETRNV